MEFGDLVISLEEGNQVFQIPKKIGIKANVNLESELRVLWRNMRNVRWTLAGGKIQFQAFSPT